MENATQLEDAGRLVTKVMPDSKKVSLRETNGDDEAFMQRAAQAGHGTAMHQMLARIVSNIEGHNGPVTAEVIAQQKSRNIYFMLFLMRAHSLGEEVKFEFQWPDIKEPSIYREDLTLYIPDYNEIGEDEEIYPFAIQPYPKGLGDIAEFELSSGKRVRYEYLTGVMENKILDLSEDKQNVESELLKVRNLQLEVNGSFQKVTGFHVFSSRDMAEIRKHVQDNDAAFEGISEVTHPVNPNIKQLVTLVQSQNFFFPVGL